MTGIKKDESVKDWKKRVKQENKSKETNMKTTKFTKLSTWTKTVLPWLVLFALACAYGGFQLGHAQGVKDEKVISSRIEAQVAAQLKTND